ncbi:hypothetical protein PGB90_008780 [Kerria lacca]
MERIKEYVRNSSFHGFHYMADPNRHWSERVFWALVFCISGYYMRSFLKNVFDVFQHYSVNLVMDTDYLEWNTTFPAISVCEHESPDKLFEVCKNLFGPNRDLNIDFFVRDVVFFDGVCYSCTQCMEGTLNCSENFDLLIKKIKGDCETIIQDCTWNEKPFKCCDNFLPLLTETGLCFTINSIQTKKKNGIPLLVSNGRTGPGLLQLRVTESIKLYIHSSEEVPFMNHYQNEKILLNWGSTYTARLQIKAIKNDQNLLSVDIEKRQCRLPQEHNLRVYNVYGYSACVVDCRSRVQMILCNCTSHYIPYNNKEGVLTCGIEGLSCLTTYAELLRNLRKEDLNKFGIKECDCLSSCDEPEYEFIISKVEINKKNFKNTNGTKINIGLDKLPTERYKRTIVRTQLDLIGTYIQLISHWLRY